MYYRLEDIFAIGIGPSSSHTVGPMKAAKKFVDNLVAKNILTKIDTLKIDLYGSLALTGIGHGTLKAIVYGLMGFRAEDVDTDKPYYSSVERDKILHLAQLRAINFDIEKDMILNKEIFLKEHSNGIKFSCYDNQNTLLSEETYFSIGGGSIVKKEDFSKQRSSVVYDVPYQFNCCKELQEICKNILTFSVDEMT